MSSLTEDDRRLIEDSLRKFVEDNYAFDERERRQKHNGKFGTHWHTFAELGWLALPFGEEAGGLGGGLEEAQLMMKHFGRGLIEEPYLEVAVMAGKVLEQLGSELFMLLIAGESQVILAHRERASIHSLEDCATSAVADGDSFILNGSKTAVSQAGAADYLLVSALLDAEPAIFQVPVDHPSLRVCEFPTIDSRYAADIELDSVVLGQDALLARGHKAADALRHGVLFTLAALLGELSGIADELVVQTSEFLQTREQFGSKLFQFQALQHKLADMIIGAEEIKSLAWLVCGVITNEDLKTREKVIRSAKARAAVIVRKMAETAVQLHGGMGVSDEMVVSHYLRRVVAVDAFYGDSQSHYSWLSSQYASGDLMQ